VDGVWVAVAVAIGVVIFLAVSANRRGGPKGRGTGSDRRGDGSVAQAGLIAGTAGIGVAGWAGDSKDPDPDGGSGSGDAGGGGGWGDGGGGGGGDGGGGGGN